MSLSLEWMVAGAAGIGLLVGLGLAWLVLRARVVAAFERGSAERSIELATAEERRRAAEREAQRVAAIAEDWRRRAEQLEAQLRTASHARSTSQATAERVPGLEASLARAEAAGAEARSEVGRLRTLLEAERKQSAEKLSLLEQAKETLTHQFENLARGILDEKSRRFTEASHHQLEQLMEPLKTKLAEFRGKVEEVYFKEGEARTRLSQEVRHLMELNQTLSRDAQNLARALRGSAQTQGAWGELILEQILEGAGLVEGEHYVTQAHHRRDDGRRVRPDVIVNLPEGRSLVIDAKVSLTAYTSFVEAELEEHKESALRQHLDSLRGHIRGLSAKSYHDLPGVRSLDFVLMFVPVEPAFMLAIGEDRSLFTEAWERNVLLVSPSTLIFVLRTVAHLWRQEAQSRNAQEIAKRGAQLYDKLELFVRSLDDMGSHLRGAQEAYATAKNRLVDGKGNAIWLAEQLKRLGVQPNNALPAEWAEAAAEGASASDVPEGSSPLASLFDPGG